MTSDTKNSPAKLVVPILRVSLQIVAGTLTVSAIALTFLLWRLSEGPVSLNFMRSHLERTFSNDNSPHRIVFTDLTVSWSEWKPYIELQSQNLTATTSNGRIGVTIPQIRLQLSIPALLRGAFVFVRAEIINPNLDIFIKQVTTGSSAYDVPLLEEYIKTPFTYLSQLAVQAVSTKILGFSLSHVEEVTISDPVLAIYSHSNAVLWRATSEEWHFNQSEYDIDAMFDATVTIHKPALNVNITTNLKKRAKTWDIKIFISDFFPNQLAQASPNLEKLAGLNFPVAGTFSTRFQNLSDIEMIKFELSTPGGSVSLRNTIGLTGEYNITDTLISGHITPDNLAISLQNIEGKIDEVNIYGSAALTNLQMDPHINAAFTATKIPIDRLAAFWPQDMAQGTRAWVLNNIRGGVVENASAYINFSQSDLHRGSLGRDQFFGEFQISNTSVDYIEGLPPARDISALGWFDGVDLHIGIEKGKVLNQEIGGTNVDFFDAYTDSEIGVLELQSTGPIADFLSIPNLSKSSTSELLIKNIENIQGLSAGKFQIHFPLIKDLAVTHLDAEGELIFYDLSLRQSQINLWREELNISDGMGTIVLDRAGFRGSGTALLNHVPVAVEWITFSEAKKSGLVSKATIRTTVSDESIKPWKDWLPFANGVLEVEVLLTSSNNDSQEARIFVDTTNLSITLPEFGFTKNIGVRADLSGHLLLKSWAPSSPLYFEIIGDELEGTAVVELDNNLGPTKIDLKNISYKGKLLDAQLFFTGAELTEIDLYTNSFDLSSIDLTAGTKPFGLQKGRFSVTNLRTNPSTYLFNTKIGYDALKEDITVVVLSEELVLEKSYINIFDDIRTRANQINNKTIDISGSIERVSSSNGGDLLNLQWQSSFQDGELIRARLEAYFNKTDKIRMEITGTGTRQKIVLTADNAGKVLQMLNLTSNLVGGKLYLEAKYDDDGEGDALVGNCTVLDFHVINTPILAQLLSISVPTNVIEILSGKGLPFDRLQIPFRYKNSSIDFFKARATGISLGITLNGSIDLNRKSADLTGTIIPAYLLNNLVGTVPIIGDILTGPEKEGIFAATYNARGSTNDLQISVNPLTVLAPGILRDLLNLFISNKSESSQ